MVVYAVSLLYLTWLRLCIGKTRASLGIIDLRIAKSSQLRILIQDKKSDQKIGLCTFASDVNVALSLDLRPKEKLQTIC